MGSANDLLTLASKFVKPYKRVVNGKVQHVDGYIIDSDTGKKLTVSFEEFAKAEALVAAMPKQLRFEKVASETKTTSLEQRNALIKRTDAKAKAVSPKWADYITLMRDRYAVDEDTLNRILDDPLRHNDVEKDEIRRTSLRRDGFVPGESKRPASHQRYPETIDDILSVAQAEMWLRGNGLPESEIPDYTSEDIEPLKQVARAVKDVLEKFPHILEPTHIGGSPPEAGARPLRGVWSSQRPGVPQAVTYLIRQGDVWATTGGYWENDAYHIILSTGPTFREGLRRGHQAKYTIARNVYEGMVHELGHSSMQANWNVTEELIQAAVTTIYGSPQAVGNDIGSRYGTSAAKELFAEMFALPFTRRWDEIDESARERWRKFKRYINSAAKQEVI